MKQTVNAGTFWTGYVVAVVAATVAWLLYSMSAGSDRRLVIGMGIVLLMLIVPLIRRPGGGG